MFIIMDYEEYVKDSRIPCRYGVKCYQKNLIHHEKYKHPPKKVQPKSSEKHVNKKMKIEFPDKINEKLTNHQNSDSDASSGNSSDSNYKKCKDGTKEFISETTESDDSSDCSEHEKSTISKNISESYETSSGLTDFKTYLKTSTNVSDSDDSDNDAKDKGNKESVNVSSHIFNSGDDALNRNLVVMDEKIVKESDLTIFIRKHFLVHMPDDFYQFWDFCKTLKSSNALEALKDIGLILVGPYDVLAGKLNNIQLSEEEYLIHWRYYRDPPEFQTVLKGEDRTGYHIGYFRDSPDNLPVFLASNHEKRNGSFAQIGGNIFSAVNFYLEDLKKIGDPFKKMHIGRIQSLLIKESNKLNIDLSRKTKEMIAREKEIVTRTLNKIGLVVPFDRKTEQGYRELAVDNKELSNIFSKLQNCKPDEKSKYLSELQPVFTFASIATDECDFGTGIELGWNIIAHGVDSLNDTAARFLSTNYRLLNKEAFAKIATAHMKNRRKGYKLSIL